MNGAAFICISSSKGWRVRVGGGGGAIINRVCTQGQLFIYETGCVDIMWPSSAPLIPLRGGQEIAPTRTQ